MSNRFITKQEVEAISMKTLTIKTIGQGTYGTIINTVPERQEAVVEFDAFGNEKWRISLSSIRQM